MATKSQRINEKLNTPKRDTNVLRFPSDIDTEGNGNIIRFRVSLPEGSKYLANGQYDKEVDKNGNSVTSSFRSSKSNSIGRRFSSNYVMTKSIIDLYMPANIQTAYGADWSTTSLGVAGSATDATKGIANVRSWEDAEGVWQAIKDVVPQSLLQTFTGTVQTLSPFNVNDLRAVAQSTIKNPYMEVIFNGVTNRTFSFTFKMIAKNATEQQTIKKIISEFKFHRAPEVQFDSNNNYFRFPSEWDISFLYRNSSNPWLFKISTCALTNFTVNYTPDGQYASHNDGSPFSTEITVEFTEMELLTKERHMEGY